MDIQCSFLKLTIQKQSTVKVDLDIKTFKLTYTHIKIQKKFVSFQIYFLNQERQKKFKKIRNHFQEQILENTLKQHQTSPKGKNNYEKICVNFQENKPLFERLTFISILLQQSQKRLSNSP